MRKQMRKYEEFTNSSNDHGHIYGFTISIPEEEEPTKTVRAEVGTPSKVQETEATV
jgi:hypothetical protein